MSTPEEFSDDSLFARVGVPWWLWREAEASVRLSHDETVGTYALDENDEGGAHTGKGPR